MTAFVGTTRKLGGPLVELAVVGLAILTLLFLSIKNFNVLEDVFAQTQLLYRHELLPISQIKEANEDLFDIERSLKRMIIARTPTARAEAKEAVADRESALRAQLSLAANGLVRLENQRRIDSIRRLYDEYTSNVDNAMLMTEQGTDAVSYVLSEDFQRVIHATDKLLDEIAASKQESALQRLEAASALQEQSRLLAALMALTILATGMVVVHLYRKHLAGPLKGLQVAMDRLSAGNLDVAIPHLDRGDAIGEMARALKRMQDVARNPDQPVTGRSTFDGRVPLAGQKVAEPSEKRSPAYLPSVPAEIGHEVSPLAKSTHDYLSSLGESLYLQGLPAEAERSLRPALALIPNSSAAFTNLARCLLLHGRNGEAETCLRRALGASPCMESALYCLSVVLASSARAAEAEACQRSLIAISPAHEGALLLTHHFLSQTGRFVDAERMVRRALSVNPRSPSTLASLAQLRLMTPADGQWMIDAEEMVPRLLPKEESTLRYAMGKYCDDLHDHERAFSNYRRANELSKAIAGNPYVADRWSRNVDRLIQGNPGPTVARLLAGSSDSERPVLVVGMPRSGTSLVEQILASHSAVFGAGELPFWRRLVGTDAMPLFDSSWSPSALSGVAASYLACLDSLDRQAARVIDKMPDNFVCIAHIHAAFPKAKLIHTVRDPIDTCLSIYFQNFSAAYSYSTDLNDLAHYYRHYRRLMRHWRTALPDGTMLEVAYEDLVANQEAVSRRMIAFLGLDWEDRCLEFQETERRVATASRWQVRQKLYTSSIERWRGYEKYLGPLMEIGES